MKLCKINSAKSNAKIVYLFACLAHLNILLAACTAYLCPMKLPSLPTVKAVAVYLKTAALQRQLLAQIEKDLALEPLPVAPGDANFFGKLDHELHSILNAIIAKHPQMLPNLIYRIDVDEKKIRSILANPEVDAAEALAQLILHRAAKKIFYRNVYNGTIKL